MPGLHDDVLAHLPDLRIDAPILDAGCGTGAWLRRLAARGHTNLFGLERDLPADHAIPAQCLATDLDWDPWPWPDKSFEFITAIEVIEHLMNPGWFLREAGRHMTGTSRLLITTPNNISLYARLKFLGTLHLPHFDHHGDATHIYPVIPKVFDRLAALQGLEPVATWTFPPTHGGIQTRAITRALITAAKPFLRDPLPGDILCMLLRKKTAT